MEKKLKELLLNDEEMLFDVVKEINSWDGSLRQLDYLNMDEFDDILYGTNPIDLAFKIHNGNFNPNDDYFKFDGYDNLKSESRFGVLEEMKDYIEDVIERLIDLQDNLYLPQEIQNILNEEDDELDLPF